MVTKLSALRVAPELDPSRYVAGANAVDAANERVAASAMQAGGAVQQAGSKISDAGNIVGRLSHQYVEGYSSQVRFEKGLNALDRALASGNATMAQAEAIIEGMHRRTGMMANADELAAQGKHQLAAAVAAANARLTTQEVVADGAAAAQLRLANATRMASFQQRNLVFQLNDVAVSLASGMNPLMVFMQQGSQIATIWGPEEGGVGRAFRETGRMAVGLVARLLPIGAIVGTLGAGFAALTTEINRTAATQVSIGDVLVATWELASEAVLESLQPVIDWFVGFWDSISPHLAYAMNVLIGTFDIAFRNIKTLWSGLPSAVGDVAIQTANAVIMAIGDMINGAIGLINDFTRGAREALAGIGIEVGEIGAVSLPTFANPYGGQSNMLDAQLRQNAEDVRGNIAGGAYTTMIGGRAQEVANRPDEEEQKAAEKAAEAYQKALDKGQQRIDQLGLETMALGMTRAAAESLRNTQQLMTEAEAAGLPMTAERVQQILQLSDAMTQAQLAFEGAKLAMEQRGPWEEMEAQIRDLDDLLANGAISWDVYGRAVLKARATATGAMLSMASEAAGLLGQIFEDNKAVAIAQAVLSAGEGIAKTLAQYPFPFNLGMAALHAGVAVAQIAKIASTTKNSTSLPGGSAIGGGGGSVATSPAAGGGAPSKGQQVAYIDVHGDTFGRAHVERLAEQFAELLKDGGGHDLQVVFGKHTT